MKNERNIGQEILAGIKDIKEWQQGKKRLKIEPVSLNRVVDLTQTEFAEFMSVNTKT